MYLGTYVSKKDSERWRILFAQILENKTLFQI